MPLRTKWNTKALLFSETAVKDFDTDTNCYMPEPIMRKLLPFAVAYVIYFLFENTWISKQLQSFMKCRVLENPNIDVFVLLSMPLIFAIFSRQLLNHYILKDRMTSN